MLFRKDIPLVLPCLSLCTGIILHEVAGLSTLWLLLYLSIAFTLIVVTSIYRPLLHYQSMLLILLFVLAGHLRIQWQDPLRFPNHFSKFTDNDSLQAGFTVIDCSKSRKGNLKITAQISGVRHPEKGWQPASGKISILVPSNSCAECPATGDTTELNFTPQPIQTVPHPYAFDYATYMRRQGVLHQAFVNQDTVLFYAPANGTNIRRLASQWRNKALLVFEKNINGEHELGVLAALVLGYKKWLSEETREDYAKTGAMHILAVSGLHTGIVAAIMLGIASIIRSHKPRYKVLKFLLACSGVWLFAIVSGLAPSVMRAALMFSLFLFARLILERPVNAYNLMAAAATGMLAYNPYLLFQVGFQLSFTALLGIFFFQESLSKSIYLPWLPAQKVWSLITLSISAQLGTLPLTLHYFHILPIYGWLSGLVVVPMAGVLLSLSFILLGSSFLFPPLASWTGTLLEYLTNYQNAALEYMTHLPISTVEDLWFHPLELILMGSCILLAALFVHTRKGGYLNISLASLLLFAILFWAREYAQSHQVKLIPYAVKGNILVEYYEGKNCYCITDLDPKEEKLNQAVAANRMAHGIRSCTYLVPESQIVTAHMRLQNGIVSTEGKDPMHLVDKKRPTKSRGMLTQNTSNTEKKD
jgi:competence protein ComEC